MDLTPQEREALASFAHTAGYDAFNAQPEGNEPDYNRATLDALARQEMEHSVLFGPLSADAGALALWQENFYRGWRFAECDGYHFDQPLSDLEAYPQA